MPNRFADRPTIPPATGGEISDEGLTTVIAAAESLTAGTLTEAEAALLQLTAAPLLRELEQYRLRVDLVMEMLAPNNVIMMRAG